jgi:hypothetical protein
MLCHLNNPLIMRLLNLNIIYYIIGRNENHNNKYMQEKGKGKLRFCISHGKKGVRATYWLDGCVACMKSDCSRVQGCWLFYLYMALF